MAYDDWGRLVSERFPDCFPPNATPEIQRDWENLQQKLSIGQSVTGTVVAKAHFGAWLDIGVGFPALLLIPDIEGLTPERYRLDEWCPVGSAITAIVRIFNDRDFQVRVWQVNPEI